MAHCLIVGAPSNRKPREHILSFSIAYEASSRLSFSHTRQDPRSSCKVLQLAAADAACDVSGLEHLATMGRWCVEILSLPLAMSYGATLSSSVMM